MTPATRFPQQLALLAATFVIAICGLVYELLAGTLSSYLLGDSVYQFSLVIGLFMSSMGIGSWLSRFVDGALPLHFVRLQLLVGLTGGFTAPILFFAFAILDNYSPLLFLLVILLGAMMGMEIPLVVRILREHFSLKTNLSNVFTADYIGALFAALLFPLVLVPQLGLLQTGFLFGILNLLVGLLALLVFRNTVATAPRKRLQWSILAGLLMLALGFVLSERFTASMETRLYQDEIIHAEDSPYQRLVLTRRQGRLRFYLNGALQFDSIDEYRYHETLVHPALGLLPQVEEVLILGGGDGMAARELLKDPRIKAITLVDLDPAVTTLFSTSPLLTRLNRHSLTDPKLTRVNTDAWKFLEQSRTLYDLVVIDLPDPNNASLSRLYS
ncbi:MAG: polyamine aminopropyltransferase, partial [Thiothrix sp.]|nr:polyamine aminopropyltransferase [Thiothrix sp.]